MWWPEKFRVANLRPSTMRVASVAYVFALLMGTIMQVTCKITTMAETNRTIRRAVSVDLQLIDGILFCMFVSIGSNGEKFCLIPDTWSDLTWVADRTVTSPAWQNKQRLHAPTRNEKFYFVEHVVGYQIDAKPLKSITSFGSVKLVPFQIAVVQTIPDDVTFPRIADGVLGLAYSVSRTHADNGFKTLLSVLFKKGLFLYTYQQFGIIICPHSRQGSRFIVGEMVKGLPTEHMHSIFLKEGDDRWKFTIDSVKIDNRRIEQNETFAIFITSCASIQGPGASINRINERLGCNLVDKKCYLQGEPMLGWPIITLGTSEYQMSLTKEQYVVKDSIGRNYSAFKPAEDDNRFWMLGAPAHFNRYTVYNIPKRKVSYASAKCE